MRHSTRVGIVAGALLSIATAPAVVHAEDDNVYDGKNYPGSMCSPTSNIAFGKTGAFYLNNSGAAATVLCPLVQDSWQSTAGLAYSKMTIYNQTAGQTFSCTETSYDVVGNFLTSRSFSTAASGSSIQYFFNGSYLSTTTAEGYMTILCTVPNNGRIWTYLVQEKA